MDPSTGDKYYENFVVTPKGSIYKYRTRKTTRDKAATECEAETEQKGSKRSRNAERAPNQA